MKPNEFWSCTYRELTLYVKSSSLQRDQDYKKNIVLANALGNKLISAFQKHPKNIDLITMKPFDKLFEDELNQKSNVQSIEEQIKNLRSRK